MNPKPFLAALLALGLIAASYATPALAVSPEALKQETREKILAPWKGDLDGMIRRRVIRVLVTYNKTNYFLDKATRRGATYEGFMLFEKELNQRLLREKKIKKHLSVYILFIPVARDQLLPYLVKGLGDIAAASLTITPSRRKQVDFSDPIHSEVRELVVTGPGAPAINSLSDLSGQSVYVRKSSSYFRSLTKLNRRLKKAGSAPVRIQAANENLETEDILEMVGAGLVPITVADDYLAQFWAKILTSLKVHPKLVLRGDAQIAWAMRKHSPQLKKAVNRFVKTHKVGTLLGNVILKRYFAYTKWARNAYAPQDIQRFKQTIAFFRKYAGQYGFDWLMITALAYQESRLDQSKRSPAGAVGVMQMLPSTAKAPPVSIPDIHKLDRNILAGVKYLRFIYDQYFKDAPMDQLNKVLFTFASYNAGPARVASLRQRAWKMGLDPNLWFRNVEVAAARIIGRETVQYVSNIFKYYLAYQTIAAKMAEKRALDKRLRK